MADKTHEIKRNRRLRQKWLSAVCALLLLVFLAAGFCVRYLSFVSQIIYQESTSHLEEVLHKSNNMLNQMVRKNLTYLHLYNRFLESTSDEAEIQAYIEKAQQDTGFASFYFLSYDGNYMTVTGETGYLGLQTNLDEMLADGDDIVMNSALPGKPQLLVFVCPETQGSYRGFAYDAIAISYYNDAVLRLLDNSAFQGNASNYVIYSDGRVVIDNSVNRKETIYNFIAMLRDHSDLTEEQILDLSNAFAQGRSGNMKVKLGDTSYYLVYEGTAVQSWTMVGLVPVSIVNASPDKLWSYTIQIVVGIAFGLAVLVILLIVRRNRATVRRKNTKILYRDELFRKLSLNVDDVFLMLDAKTSKTDYVSPNIGRLLGIPWKKVRQDVHALAELRPQNDPDRDKNFLEGLSRGEQREWDAAYLHQETRELRWFHIIAMGSEVEGRTKYILVMSDRTADKQINQALSDAVAAAETANRAKSTFLSNMSHDIRTPMNAIIGFTTLALSNIDDKERVKDYLAKTLASSNHLLSLINDVLDMSRIESGKIHLEEVEVNLSDVLHDLKTIVSGQIYAKQLELYMDATDVTDEDVYCDKTRLNQILLNLLSNAIKFTPAGGTVSVRVRQLAGKVHGCGQYEFRIKDNGIGMSPEFAKKIFEPFERERTSTVSRIQGTGLGMAITKNIVDMMGGTIEVQTAQGKGSEFIICLPLRTQDEHRPVEKITELEGLKALVVDDDFNTCDSVTKMLVKVGMRAEWTLSGKEAVLRARQSIEMSDVYHAYIIDWRLPDMNGIEVTRQIRSLHDDTPIIILTAYDWSDIEVEAKAAGVTAFCSKPMFMSDLRETLMSALGQKLTDVSQELLPEEDAEFKDKHILLVEDNELNREIAQEILREYGFRVDTAENGAVAVEKVRTAAPGSYDLVLMDVQMPVMDGYTATRQIRALEDPALAGIPILAMTANAFDEDRRNAMESGMNGFLSKPIVIGDLVQELHKIL
ncbi:hybrid sensor histidine kinase/response regulator [Faecalibacterium prausnitzii]|uniref:Circadian input-output histidine kinase CikA n=1 Tax=Faecalibacterium prausnitzii TaxID=853 RepID=A0A2A7ATA5_9FIRM|nr:hybrid sensor histidine kinase/response regulator [Faecalibacterium prausnitzii]PDX82394.1 hybrid sensor histidine kinase/response regulator [Faecalibacterium prausnitzii]